MNSCTPRKVRFCPRNKGILAIRTTFSSRFKSDRLFAADCSRTTFDDGSLLGQRRQSVEWNVKALGIATGLRRMRDGKLLRPLAAPRASRPVVTPAERSSVQSKVPAVWLGTWRARILLRYSPVLRSFNHFLDRKNVRAAGEPANISQTHFRSTFRVA